MNKAKVMEEITGKIMAQIEPQKSSLGKRSYGSYEPRQFEAGSSLGPNKKPMFEKTSDQGQNTTSGKPNPNEKAKCGRCMGLHSLQDCK